MQKRNRNVVGEKIREIRISKKPQVTQQQLAISLQLQDWKIDRFGVSKIERGIREVKDFELVMLAKALGVDVGKLFQEKKNK